MANFKEMIENSMEGKYIPFDQWIGKLIFVAVALLGLTFCLIYVFLGK